MTQGGMRPIALDLRTLVEYESQPDGGMVGRINTLNLEATGTSREEVFERIHAKFTESMSDPGFRKLIPPLVAQHGVPSTQEQYGAALDRAAGKPKPKPN